MAFVKLDCGILTSTLWFHRDCREVFITALLMAEPFEAKNPMRQICVDSLDHTGFVVPAGWYGMVPAAGVGIVRQAGLEMKEGLEALRKLGAPDLESRSQDFEGRRMVRVDGGYLILNFVKYRERDHTGAERSRRYRLRQKSPSEDAASRCDSVASHRDITQAEAEVHKEPPTPAGAGAPRAEELQTELSPLVQKVLEHWRTVAVPAGLPRVLKESPKLLKAIQTRLKDASWLGLYLEAVTFAARHPSSDWMRGGGDRHWKCTLEWFLKPDKAEETAAKARAAPGRFQGIAADTSTQSQLARLPVRKLPLAAGAT